MNEAKRINKLKKNKISFRLGENFVFKEWKNYYKMPSFIGRNIFYRKVNSFKQAKKNIKLIEKYFWKVFTIANTKIIKDLNWHYIIKQKEVQWKKLTRKMLENNPRLTAKFRKLIIINEIFWEKEKVFLDLLGSDFFYKPDTIHNIISDGKELYIFDFGLLEKRKDNSIFWWISYLSRKLQLSVINIFFVKR